MQLYNETDEREYNITSGSGSSDKMIVARVPNDIDEDALVILLRDVSITVNYNGMVVIGFEKVEDKDDEYRYKQHVFSFVTNREQE